MGDNDTTKRAEGRFVDYLNTEMTIMGILSTFCMLVVGGFVSILANIAKDQAEWLRTFWPEQRAFLFCGFGLVLVAAFLFYRQRSIMSYYVGQIYLSSHYEELADGSAQDLHARANGWITWRFYRQAFICLFSAVALLGRACLAELFTSHKILLAELHRFRSWELFLPMAMCSALCVCVTMAFAAFPQHDCPYQQSLLHPKKFVMAAGFLFRGGLE